MFSDFRKIAFLLALLEMSVLAFPLPSTSLDGNSKDPSSLGQRDGPAERSVLASPLPSTLDGVSQISDIYVRGPAEISASTPPLSSTADDDLGSGLSKRGPGATGTTDSKTVKLVYMIWAKNTPSEHSYLAVGNSVLHAGWDDENAGPRSDEDILKPKQLSVPFSRMKLDQWRGAPIETIELGTGRFKDEKQAVDDALAMKLERGQTCMKFVMLVLEKWRNEQRVDKEVVEKFKPILAAREKFFDDALKELLTAIKDGRALSEKLREWQEVFALPPDFTKERAARGLRRMEGARARNT
ncbi:hypothetical protein F5878DRAFT_626470 [Lentinula raphanica]|uniref:Uncharacterized protein n=1 Tax=Lentinula raphanica TaxID=153919 RepID=A0AA38P4J5_9AGAR|nr:hypothetical protein F5878DRAFT_626470 [Lentinula raphanica]